MGNCMSKGSARDLVSTSQKYVLTDGAFKYNKNNRQVVYVGEHSHDLHGVRHRVGKRDDDC